MNKKYALSLIIAGLVLFVFIAGQGLVSEQKVYSSQEVLRFHVLANSDSAYDQVVKHKVREAVVSYLTPSFQGVADAGAAKKIVMEQREQIQTVANTVLAAYKVPYRATVIDGRWQFPLKAYGDLILPAGDYEAVRILLGEAKGSNWWCVLFPPLCFIDINNATAMNSQDSNHQGSPFQAGSGKIEFKSKVMEWIAEVKSQ